ncbi:outer membrane beta-barrel protein, partial [Xanthovirga aplysinae]|uniref:outer membrane beta-barrel protein n=1 Tax=Xanthovirga aplysinae TaxID=2529853 RepID=UPI0012BC97B5
ITWEEKFNQKSTLQLSFYSSLQKRENNRKTLLKDNLEEEYSFLDTLQTNFDQDLISHQTTTVGYWLNKGVFSLNLRSGLQWSGLESKIFFPSKEAINKRYLAFIPSLGANWEFDKGKNISFNYGVSSQLPYGRQLREVLDQRNRLSLYLGNSDLDQSVRQNINLGINASYPEKKSTLSIFISAWLTKKAIGNEIITPASDTTIVFKEAINLNKGVQLRRPVNLREEKGMNMFFSYAFPINLLKSNFGVISNFTYLGNPNLFNGQYYLTNLYEGRIGVNLSSNVNEKLDFKLYNNLNYNYFNSALSHQSSSKRLTVDSGLNIYWNFYKNFIFRSDFQNILNKDLSGSFDQNSTVLDLGLSSRCLKNKRGLIAVSAFDILNNKVGLDYIVNDIYLEESKREVMKRFFLLSFTYRISVSMKES